MVIYWRRFQDRRPRMPEHAGARPAQQTVRLPAKGEHQVSIGLTTCWREAGGSA